MSAESKDVEVKTTEVETTNVTVLAGRYDDIVATHVQLLEEVSKLKDSNGHTEAGNAQIAALMAFNGYYEMNTVANGVFVSVDSNVTVFNNGANTHTTIDIIFPKAVEGTDKHGMVTHRFNPSKGDKFDINNHKLVIPDLNLDLTFKHVDGSNGVISSFAGTFGTGTSVQQWSGTSQNNPIPYTQWIGDYYYKYESIQWIQVVKMHRNANNDNNFALIYDYGNAKGSMSQVASFSYNLNMYVFTIPRANGAGQSVLIMGTGADHGLVSNNMFGTDSGKQRSLQTITPDNVKSELTSLQEPIRHHNGILRSKQSGNVNSNLLSALSGCYNLSSINDKAFLQIQSKLYYENGKVSGYDIAIAISLDGKTSSKYTFDSTMSFENNRLIIPTAAIGMPPIVDVTLKREYKPVDGYNGQVAGSQFHSLVTLTGSVGEYNNVKGYNYFNPVTLEGYIGSYYKQSTTVSTSTDAPTATLTIKKDDANNSMKVEFDGFKISSFVYVPLMYILAWSDGPHTYSGTILSLGTNNQHGNTCICQIILVGVSIYSVIYAFPNA